MTIKEAYDKYKHIDQLLSDSQWLDERPQSHCLHDLWLAVKRQALEQEAIKCPSCSANWCRGERMWQGYCIDDGYIHYEKRHDRQTTP